MRALSLLMVCTLLAAPAAAQVRQDPERLREQVLQRFVENYARQAALTDAQHDRFREHVRRIWEQRRDTEDRERGLVRGLEGQLRPGVAADQDSVTALLDAIVALQRDRADRLQAEQTELAAYLTPVQRAQLVLSFARLERQVQQLIQQRMQGGPPPRRQE